MQLIIFEQVPQCLPEHLFRELVANHVVKVSALTGQMVRIYIKPMKWELMYKAIDDAKAAELTGDPAES